MRRGESDTEQVPLLDEGGIEGFLRREVLPMLGRSDERQDRLRDQLYALLFRHSFAVILASTPRVVNLA